MEKRNPQHAAFIKAYKIKRIKYVTFTSLIVLALILTRKLSITDNVPPFIFIAVFFVGVVLLAYCYEKLSNLKAGRYSALLFFCGYAAIIFPMSNTEWTYRFEISFAIYVIYCVVREILTYKCFRDNSERLDISLS